MATPLPARADPHPARLVEDALKAAGYAEGSFAARGMKGEYYDPAVTGFVVKTTRDFEWEAGHRDGWRSTPAYRVYVDHAGPGGKAALTTYGMALIKAGFLVKAAPSKRFGKKLVIWLDGVYDHRGWLIDGEQPLTPRE